MAELRWRRAEATRASLVQRTFFLTFSSNYCRHNNRKRNLLLVVRGLFANTNDMARPPKDARLRKDVDLRIPLTTEQKRLIVEAAALAESDMATWLRPIILQVASAEVARAKQKVTEGYRNE
jgi:hypothetical protein